MLLFVTLDKNDIAGALRCVWRQTDIPKSHSANVSRPFVLLPLVANDQSPNGCKSVIRLDRVKAKSIKDKILKDCVI